MITQEYLKTRLSYNEESGLFVWIKGKRGLSAGTVAGTVMKDGYIHITIDRKQYLGHRLAFLYMTGDVPECCDHINRVRIDNAWANLRPSTKSQNGGNTKMQVNNKSGYRGVSWSKQSDKWKAQIKRNGVKTHIGLFSCKHHAFCEYVKKHREFFGEFSVV